MAEVLHRLVYYSRNRVPGDRTQLTAAIDDILTVSHRNNAQANITGALMFNAGCFGQVLEGNREALTSTFKRIQGDSRHSDVSLLTFESIKERSFGHWSMGFVGSRPEDAAIFAHVAIASDFNPSEASGDGLVKALRKLAIADEAKGGTRAAPRES